MSLSRGFAQTDRIADRLTETIIRRRLLPAYRDSLNTIRGDLALFFEKYAADGTLDMADAAKYNRLANLEKNIAEEMARLGGKQIRATSTAIKEVYQESYYRIAFQLEKEVQVKMGFGQLPAKQVEASLLNPMDRIGWKGRTREQIRVATRQIREEITQGIIQGRGYPDVAKDIAERMNMAAGRAERIVRTEAHRAREEGKLASLEQAEKRGVEMEKVWTSTLDGNTRDTHQDLDGQTVPMFDDDGNPGLFKSPAGNTAEYPGGFGVAEEDINCRCAVRGQIKGYSPEVRRARGEGTIPYTTYNEWKKSRISG